MAKIAILLNDVTEAFSAIGASVFPLHSRNTDPDLGWRLFVRTLELIWGVSMFFAIVTFSQLAIQ